MMTSIYMKFLWTHYSRSSIHGSTSVGLQFRQPCYLYTKASPKYIWIVCRFIGVNGVVVSELAIIHRELALFYCSLAVDKALLKARHSCHFLNELLQHPHCIREFDMYGNCIFAGVHLDADGFWVRQNVKGVPVLDDRGVEPGAASH